MNTYYSSPNGMYQALDIMTDGKASGKLIQSRLYAALFLAGTMLVALVMIVVAG
jgi:hypothetical protein